MRDEVEGLLVRDMAEIRWRLKRLLRAESACLAWQRRKLENEQRRKVAGEGLGMDAAFEQMVSQKAGYSALPESEDKYELILFVLHARRWKWTASRSWARGGCGCSTGRNRGWPSRPS